MTISDRIEPVFKRDGPFADQDRNTIEKEIDVKLLMSRVFTLLFSLLQHCDHLDPHSTVPIISCSFRSHIESNSKAQRTLPLSPYIRSVAKVSMIDKLTARVRVTGRYTMLHGLTERLDADT